MIKPERLSNRLRHFTMAFRTALVLLLGSTAITAMAQVPEQWCPTQPSYSPYLSTTGFGVYGNHGGPSGCNVNCQTVLTNESWGQDYGGVETYFSVPAGTGIQEFVVRVHYNSVIRAYNTPNWVVRVDGQVCTSCTAQVIATDVAIDYGFGGSYNEVRIKVRHSVSNAWPTGVHEFGLAPGLGAPPNVTSATGSEIRFKAVMVGKTYSDLLGYYNAPALPYFILRDPPGDESYASMSQGSTTCSGFSQSASTSTEENVWFKGKIGIAGSIGWIVDLPFEVYAEIGTDITAEQSETSNLEYETCFEAASEFTTSASGTPDDMFIGSAIRYAYGMQFTVERPSCGTITTDANFASEAVSVIESYHHTESHIRNTVIPQLTAQIAVLTPGTTEHESKTSQLNVWNQTLALNDSIKAAAPFAINRAFSGGGAGQTFSQTSTTNQTRAIDYTVALEEGLSFEFGAYFGGSGVGFGSSMKMRSEYGSGINASNANTNSMSYHLEDGDVFDSHAVKVHKDEVFGSYVFFLDTLNSRTSCKYEGGYRLDQPQLSIGTIGNTSMNVNEAAIGTQVNYPLILCNNSDTTRTYFLRFSAVSNAQGAVMQAFGNTLNSNDDGIPIELLGGQCVNTNLTLTQPSAGVLDFDNINLYLYSLCEEEYPPYIRSYATISAHFGTGNFGNYCTPVSTIGTAEGDYIAGVQLGNINNTGTGGITAPSYTDYSGTFSTPLSRTAQRVVTITTGSRVGSRYAAWIDYDHSGTFEESEKLGAFNSTAMGQVQDISFTVPATAALGSTIMRVRAVNVQGGEPAVLGACFNYNLGETEDYAVVVNNDPPQDCAGVSNGTALPGTPCDDGNVNTGNDSWTANCTCVGQVLDCAGTPGGTAVAGTPCDDGNAVTGNDVYGADCVCVGQLIDCTGTIGGTALVGSPCNDNNPNTTNDVYTSNCTCAGQLIDCLGVAGGTTLPGSPCDDGNPLSGDDAYNVNCQCVGTVTTDCMGVVGGPAQPGTPCNDNNATTGNDTYGTNCICAGLSFDCTGTAGGTQLPGTPCNDGNANTTNDMFNANCQCAGTLATDCAGVPGGTAQPGSTCDDGLATTGNDTYDANCECVGQVIDCNGVTGGSALPGVPCNDNDPLTGNDLIDANCQCAGLLIDCEGVAGGTNTVGTPCDDGNANTTNDVYTANCNCAGALATDCAGVPGGTAQPGSPCDDGDANTGNDVYNTDCECAGLIIDCTGAIGGTALPGSMCNDNDPCTANDQWSANCECAGTAVAIGTINGPAMADAGSTVTYYITPIAGATNYTWTLPSGWSSTNTNDFVLVATAGTTIGTVDVCVDAIVGGCTVSNCISVQLLDPNGISEVGSGIESWFTVQPNPSNGVFQLVPADENAAMNITVYDGTGRVVKAPFLVVGKSAVMIDMADVAPGSYYVFAQREGQQRVVNIMVQR
ncbi:MAG: T9SS type A sorting domain-containing protein [Flavobacteriales bacterium]|nr:T9SS type A sorting domain-containing protein [Flavobacteriales bacterium]